MRQFDEFNQELLPLIPDEERGAKDVSKPLSLRSYATSVWKYDLIADGNLVLKCACACALIFFFYFSSGSSRSSAHLLDSLPHSMASSQSASIDFSSLTSNLETVVRTWKKISAELWSPPRKQEEGNVAASGELLWTDRDPLWSMFGQSRGQTGERNRAMVDMLRGIRPRRVFEWAGYGGFFLQRVLLDTSLRSSIQHWVHAEYALGALDYAVFLMSNDTLLANPDSNADIPRMSLPMSWHASLPFVRYMPTTNPTLALEVVELDVENISQVMRTSDLTQFDAFVTITFGHFVPDYELIRLMKPGSFFVFCVANFGARKGVRRFHSIDEIRDRYRDQLEIIDSREVTDPSAPDSHKKKFVVSSRVKART